MLRKNETFRPCSCEVPPNGLYEAYRAFFDQVFVQEEFESNQLREFFIFDRHAFVKPKFIPGKGWQEVEVLQDPELESQFQIEEHFGKYEKELLSFLLVNNRSKLLKIVGDVGTGKSTFLQYMFNVFLPKQKFFENMVYIPLDLRKIFQLHEEYTHKQTIELLEQSFSQVFKDHLVVSSVENLSCPRKFPDILEFLKQLVKTYGPNKVIVTFDNVDMFEPGFQNHLWSIAQQMAACTGVTTIICMRHINSRYFQSIANDGASNYYLIEQRPPMISKVAQRRLLYFLNNYSGIKENRIVRIQTKDIVVTFSDLQEFAEKFMSLIGDSTINYVLESMTNYNVRVALLWILGFLRSWNLNVPQMVKKVTDAMGLKSEDKPSATFDTLINAIGLWNHSMYFPTCSSLENIFSAHLKESKADLLIKYRCLKYCDVHGDKTDKNSLIANLKKLGYSDSEIKEAVVQLLAHPRRLLRSNDGNTFKELHTLELNPAGKFYLDRLLFFLDYLQSIAVDCYLPEELVPRLDGSCAITHRILGTIGIIEFIGKRELDEMSAGKEKIGDGFLEEYQRIYGEELLAIRLLNYTKSDIRSIFKSSSSGLSGSQSSQRIRVAIDLIIRRLSQKLQHLLEKSQS